MLISTRGRYGIIAMIEIASQQQGEYISVKKISEKHGISEHYLEQLMMPLKKSNFLKTSRGSKGGYAINGDTARITLSGILNCLEGPMYPVDCINSENKTFICGVTSCDTCVTKPIWESLHKSINNILEAVSLADLVTKYMDLNKI